MIRDEKGVTLLEVLIAIVILSFIFLSIMNFFPQMGLINKANEDKAKAVNYANELLIEWKNSESVKDCIKNKNGTSLSGYYNTDSNYYYYKTSKGGFNAIIKIRKNTDLISTPVTTRLIDIQLFNNRNNMVAETYGYIILR
ncbi:prepilin-type N-terminal cleavage/methylation domain-containing protein [Neobacillus drentensis]|uniref:prepilin-type N-terminal cleavage/methylation domain-containing protein n=1 Tax=Neobacillus drentensis TaxID=220684 RepID=UPI0030003BE3